MTEFLLDENVLGVADLLGDDIKYKKVGDDDCPAKEANDSKVAKYAKDNNLVIVTGDKNMIRRCELENIECVSLTDMDLAKKIQGYQKRHADTAGM